MQFASREDAGRCLGRYLKERGTQAELVLGLPRGGVVVAAEVARALHLPLEVLVVRKIGHPFHREFAVGALAELDVVVLDEAAVGHDPFVRAELRAIIDEERTRLESYLAQFRRPGSHAWAAQRVLVVDDGLATGATTEAAVLSARRHGARQISVAVPVASSNAVERLQGVADEVLALCVDPAFESVGRYYDVFSQTTDEQVLDLLNAA